MTRAPARPVQGDVWWVNLDPTMGAEIQKRRPCLIVSPDAMNDHLGTVIAAPITSVRRDWPTRLAVTLRRRKSFIALDQIRTVDKVRLVQKVSHIDPADALSVLREMFA